MPEPSGLPDVPPDDVPGGRLAVAVGVVETVADGVVEGVADGVVFVATELAVGGGVVVGTVFERGSSTVGCGAVPVPAVVGAPWSFA